VRTRLTGNATLIALVAAANIHIAQRPQEVGYPCITLDLDGSRGGNFANVMSGYLTIQVYTQASSQPAAALDAICYQISALLHEQETNISNGSVSVGVMQETYLSPVISEIDEPVDTRSQTLRYYYIAERK